MARKAAKSKQVKTIVRQKQLTDKELMFIEQYFICKLNGTEAAWITYNCQTRASAATQAWELLRKPEIRARIDERLAKFHMDADEVLTRMAFHARGSMEEFLDPDSNTIDLKKAKQAKALGLIKRFRTKFTTTTKTMGDETQDVETLEVEIELYDAQAALRDLGKHLGLFVERNFNLNADLSNLSDEQLRLLSLGKAPLMLGDGK